LLLKFKDFNNVMKYKETSAMTLKAVIFDVGGVLIRTHSRAGREKWAVKLGLDAWEFENFVFSGESGRQAQLGQKTHQIHWRWLGDYFNLDETSLAEMRRDFFAGDALNEPLVEHIKRLRVAGYRLGLLSNFTDRARLLWSEAYPFIQYFDGVVISAEVGLMKPDPQIYYLAAESVGVAVTEALFVDDFIENIEAAAAIGMPTIHFTDPETARRELAIMTGVE
jgi:epoxide hydrolase-like predicted phosphatase